MSNKFTHSQKGFLLLEISVTLAICVVAISLIIPSIAFFHKTFIDLQLEHIRTVCCYMQQKSLIEARSFSLMIDVANNRLNTQYGNIVMPAGIVFSVIPSLLGPPSKPHKIITKACSFVSDTIFFYPDGTASAGALYIADAYGQCQYALTINADKGCCIRKYVYRYAQWHLL